MATEAPLNLAHQQDRKAERFLNVGKFQDAILCHQKAAEYILAAMDSTSVGQALASLQLQYENHQKQQKVILEKERRYILMEKRQAMKLEDETKSSPLGSRKPSETEIDDVDGGRTERNQNVDMGTDPVVRYSRRTKESDSLLQFLNNGHSSHLDPQLEESVAFVLAASTRESCPPLLLNTADPAFKKNQRLEKSGLSVEEESTNGEATNGTMTPKDESEVVEELREENAFLKSHIVKLQRAWESCEQENMEMRATIHDLKRQMDAIKSSGQDTQRTDITSELKTPFSTPASGFVDTPLSELPPLAPIEFPELGFDLSKLGSSPPQ